MTLSELLGRLPEIDRAAGFTVRAEHLEGLYKVICLIDADVSEHHHMRALAKHGQMNIYHLKVLCKQVTGFSLFQYLIEKRMLMGAKLLRDTDEKVQSIAFQCGYRYQNDFAERFRKRFGVSPSEYREGCTGS